MAFWFFLLLFGIMELARVMYMYNTLAEATKRAASAAANTNFRNTTDLETARQYAIFRNSPGALVAGDPITDQHIRIDYLYLEKQGATFIMKEILSGSLPNCPSQNRQNCLSKPYDSSCIRLVRARVCDKGRTDVCDRVQYQPLFGLMPLQVPLPSSTTIVNAETLGYSAGDALCP